VNLYQNGAAGFSLVDAKRSTNTSAVALDRIAVYKNGPTSYIGGRQVGGVLLQSGLPSALTMKGSTICGNAEDEVAVYSDASWNLSGDACGPTSNAFFVPGVVGDDYFIYSTAATDNVSGLNNYYVANPPSTFLKGVTYDPPCGSPPAVPAYCN
jgi:hypothetical protein